MRARFPQRLRDVIVSDAQGKEVFRELILQLQGEAVAALGEVKLQNQEVLQALQQVAQRRDIGVVFREMKLGFANTGDLLKELGDSFGDTVKVIISQPRSSEEAWEKLQALATNSEEMGAVLATPETLGMWTPESNYEKLVPWGSLIHFEVNLRVGGHLLLLEKNPGQQIWCLCPSFLAPQPFVSAGKTILPQPGAKRTAFHLQGVPGLEQILAVITKEVPSVDWIPKGSEQPLQLNHSHLVGLLDYLNQVGEYQLLYTEYTVTGNGK
ncbi:MAG: DUF4384 domain-containing protein [Nostocaceae cyanobacterium]|nr:DUF4384 domain-containing protein [Nostocaceae cyanobacterium]